VTTTAHALASLADRWRRASPSERANAQLYIPELCDALGVEKPRPAGTGYEFEYAVRIVHRDGTETVGRIDLCKRRFFLLEGVPFEDAVEKGAAEPERFGRAVAGFWEATDTGGDWGPLAVLRSIGYVFHDRDARHRLGAEFTPRAWTHFVGNPS
jgi:hypothetical protein